MSLNSCSIVAAFNLTVSVGRSSIEKTSSNKFFKSNPSSTSEVFLSGSPFRTFSKLFFDLFSTSFLTIRLLLLNSTKVGSMKKNMIIARLLSAV